MKHLFLMAAAALVGAGCDPDQGTVGGRNVETGEGVPGRGTRALDVRNPPGTDTQKVIQTGPGGAIPGGTRTTSPSIPGAGDTNFRQPKEKS
jgi:hypothetical protein